LEVEGINKNPQGDKLVFLDNMYYDIVCDMINQKRTAKLRSKIADLREKGGIKPSELESLAKACGRIRHRRGKEPTWINPDIPTLWPLSIPHHRELNRFTAQSILDQLEGDLDTLEERKEENA
jgi:hypothetical protein